MMAHLNLRSNEIMIFTINKSAVMHRRIYQKYGKEIEYSINDLRFKENEESNWFWDVDLNSDSDSKTGVGMKFLLSLTGRALEMGEMIVPKSFYKRFVMVIPASITFELRNGEVYHGNYVADEKKVIGLKYLHRRDTLLFTYVGNGRFELVIFDNLKVEKYFAVSEAQSDADVEMEAQLSLQLEHNEISLKLEEDEISEEQTDDPVEEQIMNEADMDEEEMDHIVQEFTVSLTVSNVNHSSHGVVSLSS
ncbi:hypothetical protein POM88_049822 [Heracleum sosnowskyi]|uniref:Uncharacterized protein n=1 Tax=Heracleum sosnowskyi TaxID=360622 RepID=A0AAD8M0W6_9APIA|nr:hypothetical protein POM88_049822 [Heracleum sosnowskyi]